MIKTYHTSNPESTISWGIFGVGFLSRSLMLADVVDGADMMVVSASPFEKTSAPLPVRVSF